MMKRIEFAVVHTCGAYDFQRKRVVHQSVGTVRSIHMLPLARYDGAGKLVPGTGGRGFNDIGYNRYIEVDGKVRLGRLDTTPGAHTEGLNDRSLGVCCSGHGDYEKFNPAQMRSLIAQCAAWGRLYTFDHAHVIGHHEAPQYGAKPTAKSCPGTLIDMDEIRALVRDELLGVVRGVVLEDLARCPPSPAAAADEPPPSTRRDGSKGKPA